MKSHLFHVAGLHFHMTKQTLPTLFSWQSQSCVLLLLSLTDHMICTWAELEHTGADEFLQLWLAQSDNVTHWCLAVNTVKGFSFSWRPQKHKCSVGQHVLCMETKPDCSRPDATPTQDYEIVTRIFWAWKYDSRSLAKVFPGKVLDKNFLS